MLRVLIADDEPSHRIGLTRHVHWNELGYETPLQAEDAEEALFLTRNSRIDVLIADVCMPGMDGIELVRRMRERYPDICVLIISGYEEFEFARSAVEAGAKAYLLKPLKIDEVESWMLKFRDEIRISRKLEEADLIMKKKLSTSLRIAKERFLEELLEDTCDEETLAHRIEILDLPQKDFSYRIAVFTIDDYTAILRREPGNGHTFICRMMTMVEAALRDPYKLVVKTGSNRIAAFVFLQNDTTSDTEELENYFELIKYSAENKLNASLTICISNEGYSWKQAKLLYSECLRQMGTCRQYEKGHLIWCESAEPHKLEFLYDIAQMNEKITGYMRELDSQKIEDMIKEAFEYFILENRFTLGFIQSFSLGIISELSRCSELAGVQMDKSYTEYCTDILNCVSTDEIKNRTLIIILSCIKSLREYQNQRKSKVIELVSQYIKEHLKEDTTVRELSEMVHMNPSYLSVLFKKEMGMTITEYVNGLRIEKAKALLQQDCKVFDIAQQVGYQNPSYFSNQFRKAVGCTPAEYRKYVL